MDIRDEDGYCPIHHTASVGNKMIIDSLFVHGASVEVKTKSGEAALYFACANGHVDSVRALLSRGAEVNVFDDD